MIEQMKSDEKYFEEHIQEFKQKKTNSKEKMKEILTKKYHFTKTNN